MRWIELIALRSISNDQESLEKRLKELIDDVNKEADHLTLTLYKRVLVGTDVGIHIAHHSKKVEDHGSQLGLCLVTALKEYGVVNHSIWVEIDHS